MIAAAPPASFAGRLLEEAGLPGRRHAQRGSLSGRRGAVALFVFEAGSALPSHFLKVARQRGSRFLRKEWLLLRRLRSALGEELRPPLPEPLRWGRVEGREFALYPFEPGAPLDPAGGRARERLPGIFSWLTEVGRATAGAPLGARRLLGAAGADERLRGAIERALPRLAPAPAALEHGDLLPANLLVRPGAFVVTDWEGARRRGLPLADAVHLALACGLSVPEAEEALGDPARRFGLEPSDVLLAYLLALGRIRRLLEQEWRGTEREGSFPFEAAERAVRARLLP